MRNSTLAAAAAVALFTAPAAFATPTMETFDLTTSSISGVSGDFGTITLTQASSTEVDVEVQLAMVNGYQAVFAKTGGPHVPVAFDLDSAVSGTAAVSILAPSGGVFQALAGTVSDTPYGSFTNGVSCPGCGNGTSPPNYSAVTFDVTNASGITLADFIQNTNGYYFGADVGVNGKTGSVASNTVGSQSNPPVGSIPEPASMAVLGMALLGLAGARRLRA
jgi:hypothetical protein